MPTCPTCNRPTADAATLTGSHAHCYATGLNVPDPRCAPEGAYAVTLARELAEKTKAANKEAFVDWFDAEGYGAVDHEAVANSVVSSRSLAVAIRNGRYTLAALLETVHEEEVLRAAALASLPMAHPYTVAIHLLEQLGPETE